MKKFIISAIALATIAAGGTTAFALSGNGQAPKEETSQVCTVADQVRQCSLVAEKQAKSEQCLYNGEAPEDGTGMKNRAGQNSESGNGNQKGNVKDTETLQEFREENSADTAVQNRYRYSETDSCPNSSECLSNGNCGGCLNNGDCGECINRENCPNDGVRPMDGTGEKNGKCSGGNCCKNR
ncbi:MAG: hypothetical protein ACI4G1_02990 [Ruminococcus sp.]